MGIGKGFFSFFKRNKKTEDADRGEEQQEQLREEGQPQAGTEPGIRKQTDHQIASVIKEETGSDRAEQFSTKAKDQTKFAAESLAGALDQDDSFTDLQQAKHSASDAVDQKEDLAKTVDETEKQSGLDANLAQDKKTAATIDTKAQISEERVVVEASGSAIKAESDENIFVSRQQMAASEDVAEQEQQNKAIAKVAEDLDDELSTDNIKTGTTELKSASTKETTQAGEAVEIEAEATQDSSQVQTEPVNQTVSQADKDAVIKPAETEATLKSEDSEKSVQTITKLTNETTPQSEKQSFFERLKKTRQNISFGLEALIKGKQISEELYEDLETALLTADLGVDTTNEVIEKLRVDSKIRELHDAGALRENLKNILKNILKPCEIPLEIEKKPQRPYVILMVGVNGAGKTTTIGKLVEKYKAQNLKVMLAAGDTFRAAAVEQLKAWGTKADVPVIAQEAGSDSASVIFDALKSATARSYDVLICDTAGRLQNKDYLMEELKKIVRVMKKTDETVPDEVMLVLDATTGQNAVSQTKLFSEAVKVTGLCITKLDGSAKGGVVFALADKYKIPVRYVGIGEKAEDLRTFKVDSFVDALIDE